MSRYVQNLLNGIKFLHVQKLKNFGKTPDDVKYVVDNSYIMLCNVICASNARAENSNMTFSPHFDFLVLIRFSIR